MKEETISITKQEEANLILRLYEIRRDDEFRKARKWYDTEFNPQSAQDILGLLSSGFAQSAYFRMVTTYWEMAAALANYGSIAETLFHSTNVEHMRCFAKVEPFISEVRKTIGPDFLPELEKLVKSAPDFEKKLAGWRELNKQWTDEHK